MGGRVINAVIWHPPRVFVELMTGQWNVLDELVRIPAKGLARRISVVYPDLIGVGKIERFAGISPESRNRVDHFPRAQIHNFNRPLVFPGNKQALAFDVHRHMVEVALNIWQWNALDLFQWRAGLTLRPRNQNHVQSPENRQVLFHSFAPQLAFSIFTSTP